MPQSKNKQTAELTETKLDIAIHNLVFALDVRYPESEAAKEMFRDFAKAVIEVARTPDVPATEGKAEFVGAHTIEPSPQPTTGQAGDGQMNVHLEHDAILEFAKDLTENFVTAPTGDDICISIPGEIECWFKPRSGDLTLHYMRQLIKRAILVGGEEQFRRLSRAREQMQGEVEKLKADARTAIDAGEKMIATLTSERNAAHKDADDWKHQADMFANAWQRELREGIPIRSKTHLIDALVLTTQDLVADRNGLRQTLKDTAAELSTLRTAHDQLIAARGTGGVRVWKRVKDEPEGGRFIIRGNTNVIFRWADETEIWSPETVRALEAYARSEIMIETTATEAHLFGGTCDVKAARDEAVEIIARWFGERGRDLTRDELRKAHAAGSIFAASGEGAVR